MSGLELPDGGSPFDELRRVDERGEYWLARDLMAPFGYARWQRFADAIERAITALRTNGEDPARHITEAGKKMIKEDYRLTRYGAYAVVQGGDPRKPGIAAAWAYFRVRTREAEVAPARPALPQSYAEALRELAGQVEDNERIKAELESVTPRAQAWDTLASGDGDYSVADAAKILSRDPALVLGRDRLFSALADLDPPWTFRQPSDNRWRAYQRVVDRGCLTERIHPDEDENGSSPYPPQVRVTVKGLYELHRRLGGLQPLRLYEQAPLLAIVRSVDAPPRGRRAKPGRTELTA